MLYKQTETAPTKRKCLYVMIVFSCYIMMLHVVAHSRIVRRVFSDDDDEERMGDL